MQHSFVFLIALFTVAMLRIVAMTERPNNEWKFWDYILPLAFIVALFLYTEEVLIAAAICFIVRYLRRNSNAT